MLFVKKSYLFIHLTQFRSLHAFISCFHPFHLRYVSVRKTKPIEKQWSILMSKLSSSHLSASTASSMPRPNSPSWHELRLLLSITCFTTPKPNRHSVTHVGEGATAATGACAIGGLTSTLSVRTSPVNQSTHTHRPSAPLQLSRLLQRTWHLLNCYSIHTSIRQASNEWTWMNSSSFRLSFLRRWWCNCCHRCLGNTLPGGKPQSASVSHTSISLGLRKFHETLLLLFQLHAKNDAMQPELPPRRCRGKASPTTRLSEWRKKCKNQTTNFVAIREIMIRMIRIE